MRFRRADSSGPHGYQTPDSKQEQSDQYIKEEVQVFMCKTSERYFVKQISLTLNEKVSFVAKVLFVLTKRTSVFLLLNINWWKT